jgi:hypothetical protein
MSSRWSTDREDEIRRLALGSSKFGTMEFKVTGWKGKELLSEIQKFIQREQMSITVRQAYYYLLSQGLINHKQYGDVVELLVEARRQGIVNWEDVSEGTRPTYRRDTCDDLKSYLLKQKGHYWRETFRRGSQRNFIIVFIEKDALSTPIWNGIGKYLVPIVVTRGYMSWGGFFNSIVAHKDKSGRPVGFQSFFPTAQFDWKALCFYDFDPHGIEAYRLLKRQFAFFKIPAQVELVLFDETRIVQVDQKTSTMIYDSMGKLGKLDLKTVPQPKPKGTKASWICKNCGFKTTTSPQVQQQACPQCGTFMNAKVKGKRKAVLDWLKKRDWRCELDSLSPTQLKTIAEEQVLKYLNVPAFELEQTKDKLESTYIVPVEPYDGFTRDLEIAKSDKDLQSIDKKARV